MFASLQSSAPMARVRGKDAVVVAECDVALRDVCPDGNCFFHAFQHELPGSTAQSRPRILWDDMPQGLGGQLLWEWLLHLL